jgi:hypothetical protein
LSSTRIRSCVIGFPSASATLAAFSAGGRVMSIAPLAAAATTSLSM